MSSQTQTTTRESSTSWRFTRRGESRIRETPTEPVGNSLTTGLVECKSLDSLSPLTSLYNTPAFRRDLLADLSGQVAVNAIRLRKLRGYSQVGVARAMGTSQAKVARIEGGDENITLRTLRRLAVALKGRIRIAVEPEELYVPTLPAWRHMAETDLSAGQQWRMRGVAVTHKIGAQNDDAPAQGVAVIWTTGQTTAGCPHKWAPANSLPDTTVPMQQA